ncbi:hypothetical protein V1477_008830 [Vespula maculifrons]|uniref:Uncharacterized protein n=1 Tax=Vespula maculifrons TaxID=7453 RepID=A0ABD2CE52_VESMC
MVVLLPSSSLFWKGKEDLDGKRAGGRNYDRRPVASLTDDASLRSRLRAQKDGTTVNELQCREHIDIVHEPRLILEPVPIAKVFPGK